MQLFIWSLWKLEFGETEYQARGVTINLHDAQLITAKAHQRANTCSILRCFAAGNMSSLVRACLVYTFDLC